MDQIAILWSIDFLTERLIDYYMFYASHRYIESFQYCVVFLCYKLMEYFLKRKLPFHEELLKRRKDLTANFLLPVSKPSGKCNFWVLYWNFTMAPHSSICHQHWNLFAWYNFAGRTCSHFSAGRDQDSTLEPARCFQQGQNKYEDKCKVVCNSDGYILEKPSAEIATCSADGHWAPYPTTCIGMLRHFIY